MPIKSFPFTGRIFESFRRLSFIGALKVRAAIHCVVESKSLEYSCQDYTDGFWCYMTSSMNGE